MGSKPGARRHALTGLPHGAPGSVDTRQEQSGFCRLQARVATHPEHDAKAVHVHLRRRQPPPSACRHGTHTKAPEQTSGASAAVPLDKKSPHTVASCSDRRAAAARAGCTAAAKEAHSAGCTTCELVGLRGYSVCQDWLAAPENRAGRRRSAGAAAPSGGRAFSSQRVPMSSSGAA